MPILVKGAGSGSGGSGVGGYRYQLGNVVNLDYEQTMNIVSIRWQDPENILLGGKILSQWQGTLIVEKEGSKPISVDDGKIIYNSRTKNQFASSPLVIDKTNEGGVGGFYYGVFPYTKDYVVNVLDGNIIYCQFPDINAKSWTEIEDAFYNGNGKKWWPIGTIKNIHLDGDFNIDAVCRIIDFDNDYLWFGSNSNEWVKSAVTLSIEGQGETLIGQSAFTEDENYNIETGKFYKGGWDECTIKTDFMPKVMNALPEELQTVIKSVKKTSTAIRLSGGKLYTSTGYFENKLFIPSANEIIGNKGWTSLSGSIYNEGTPYKYYDDKMGLTKDPNVNGSSSGNTVLFNGESFYTRTIGRDDYFIDVFYFERGSGNDSNKTYLRYESYASAPGKLIGKEKPRGVLPMFCI